MITLFNKEDTKRGRAPTKPYGVYSLAISEHIPEQISKSKDDHIYIRKNDLEETLGIKIIAFDSLLWALKFVLFEHGMVINKAHMRDGSRIFSIRIGIEDDVLPESLRRLLIE